MRNSMTTALLLLAGQWPITKFNDLQKVFLRPILAQAFQSQ